MFIQNKNMFSREAVHFCDKLNTNSTESKGEYTDDNLLEILKQNMLLLFYSHLIESVIVFEVFQYFLEIVVMLIFVLKMFFIS